METRRILIDTSVLIEYFRKKDKTKSTLWKLLDGNDELCISVITEFEFLCGCKTCDKRNEATTLLSCFSKLSFNSAHSNCASEIYNELRSTNQMIGVLDILIAGVARYETIPIMTLNIKHFRRVSSLNLLKSI